MNDPLGDWISVTKLWGADLTMCRGAEADDLERDAVDAVAFVLVVEGSIISDGPSLKTARVFFGTD